MTLPKISICTPTWQRHDLLFTRCIPSVQAQDYAGEVEHIVVSDGPDPELAAALAQPWLDGWKNLWYRELARHEPAPNFGHYARRAAIDYASGELIGYLDDDDAFRADHCRLLAAALDADPEAGFAVSRMLSHYPGDAMLEIGRGPLACGNVGSPMIMNRREILETANWGPPSALEDWEVVERWLAAGIKCANVDAVTSDVWPSRFRAEEQAVLRGQ
jgi:glycosyltransferase involved in cell wall biosynthesis